MESIKIACYSAALFAALLALAVLTGELWRSTKLIPFTLIKAILKIRSLFFRPVPIQSKQTDTQFTGTLTLSDFSTGRETAQPICKKPSFNRSEFAKKRKRGTNGRFV
jgi:hypothetical protein